MDMKFQLRTSMQQRLVMTPKLQQALKLLQVPTLELEHILKQEIMQNPLLEEVEYGEDEEEVPEESAESEDAEEPAEDSAQDDPTKDFDLDDYLDDSFKVMGWEPEREDLDERFERVTVAPESGIDQLVTQLHLSVDDDLDNEIGEYLIGNLNPDGFLAIDLEEVARVFEIDLARAQSVLDVIQTFDPPGIGARNLQEGLLLQLKARNLEDSLIADIIRDHFDALKNRKFAEIARELKISPREVQEIAEEIGHLDPRPGLSTLGNEARYVTPDLVVDKVDGEYVVYLNDSNIPRLRISQTYVEELNRSKSEGDTETREFILGKLNSAKWLIQTIEQRRRTIVKVMQCIVEEQREFFEKGAVALRPLTLQQVATQIGMHESTVSRVTTNKYVQTPRGVFELKYFFSSSLDTDDGDSMSSKAAKTRISKIISLEDKSRPLSDQKIVDILKADGLNIARRTVAKYREQLGILPARMRKTY
jgi:RNA polymerase sigma-54 factor